MKLKNLHKDNGYWGFWFGNGNDFSEALNKLKSKVPLQDWKYIVESDHLWKVIEGKYDDVSAEIFENFEQSKEILENQQSLF